MPKKEPLTKAVRAPKKGPWAQWQVRQQEKVLRNIWLIPKLRGRRCCRSMMVVWPCLDKS